MLTATSKSSAFKQAAKQTRSHTIARAASVDAKQPSYVINVIPNNGQWSNGIPPVMGAHLMASGVVAPVSTSKGAGIDIHVHSFQYPTTEINAQVAVNVTAGGASKLLTKYIVEASEDAIKKKGCFTLVLSGGCLPKHLETLAKSKAQWDKFHIFFVDERVVPLDSEDSNYKAVSEAFLSKVGIPASQVYTIKEGLKPREAAIHYEGTLLGLPASALPKTDDGFPIFDMIVLGVGVDGHVASLFPNKGQTSITSGWVVPVENAPKAPAQRITFTMPAINNAKDIVIFAVGEEKAEVVHRTLEVQSLPGAVPAQLVRPTQGRLRWVLDVPSAQLLDIANWDDKKQYPRSQ